MGERFLHKKISIRRTVTMFKNVLMHLIFQFNGKSLVIPHKSLLLICNYKTLYQDKLTTDKKPTVGYSIPDEIPTTCFQLCQLVQN